MEFVYKLNNDYFNRKTNIDIVPNFEDLFVQAIATSDRDFLENFKQILRSFDTRNDTKEKLKVLLDLVKETEIDPDKIKDLELLANAHNFLVNSPIITMKESDSVGKYNKAKKRIGETIKAHLEDSKQKKR